MKNDYMSKLGLFISSYLPLYLWLLLSNLNYKTVFSFLKNFNLKQVNIFVHFNLQPKINVRFKNLFVLTLLFLIIISIYEIRSLLIGDGSEKKPLPKSVVINPESDSLMNYVMTYFTPLVSFNIHDSKSIVMNVLLFCTIGLMYAGGSATYFNPVLGIFGFKVFGVSGYPKAHHIISSLSFDEIETAKKRGDDLIRYRLGDGVYMIRPIKKRHKGFFTKKTDNYLM